MVVFSNPVCVSFNLTLLQFRLNQDERARGFLSKSVGSRVGEKGQDVFHQGRYCASRS